MIKSFLQIYLLVVTSLIVYVFALLVLGATFSFVTPNVAMKFLLVLKFY